MNSLKRHKLLWIAVTAFATRLLFVIIFPGPTYFAGISSAYLGVADNVLQGRGFVVHVDVSPLSAQSSQWSYEPFIDRPLGYVLLVLIPHALVHHVVAVQLFHALLAALSSILLFRIAARFTDDGMASMASLLYACWPLSARFESVPLPDAVMPFFLLLSFWLFLKGRESGLWYWYSLCGLAFGAGIMMRPDILFLPLLLGLTLFVVLPVARPVRSVLVLLVSMSLVIGVQTAQNYSATNGRFLPLGLGNGISMWEGISQFGDSFGTVFGDERMTALEGYHSWAYPNGIDRDQKRFREAIGIIKDHPFWYGWMMIKRIPVLLTPDWIMTNAVSPSLRQFLDSSPDHTVGSYLLAYPFASLIRFVLILLQYAALFLSIIALAGANRPKVLWLPALVIVYYLLIHIPTNTEARYFYPVTPFVLLLATFGFNQLRHHIHARQRHDSRL